MKKSWEKYRGNKTDGEKIVPKWVEEWERLRLNVAASEWWFNPEGIRASGLNKYGGRNKTKQEPPDSMLVKDFTSWISWVGTKDLSLMPGEGRPELRREGADGREGFTEPKVAQRSMKVTVAEAAF